MDRLDHMGELRSGEKYAPQYIEGRLRFSPYIKDAMVIGAALLAQSIASFVLPE